MRKLWFLAILGWACVASARGRKPPAVYDLTPLFTDPTTAVPLVGNRSLPLRTLATRGARILFEDKFPGANWGHPAVVKVIDPAGNVIEEAKTMLPPKDLALAPRVDTETLTTEAPVEFKLNNFDGKRRLPDPSHFYAVLINGAGEKRHWNDFSFLYRVLTQVYGYQKKNIFVADTEFKTKASDLDGDGTPDIEYGSTKAEIVDLLTSLKSKLDKNDHLILAVNDHGNNTGGESTIVLHDSEMKASEFTPLLKALTVGKLLALYEQCYSGGFVRPSVAANRVVMSAATNLELSFATEDLNFDEFFYHVVSAFAGQKHDGTLLNSDLNHDGRISAQEAFAYASGMDSAPESPLLEANLNSGGAAKIGFDH